MDVNKCNKLPSDYEALYRMYMSDALELCKGLYDIFEKAVNYVQKSLDVYNDEFLLQPVLNPPESFWETNKRQRVEA